MSASMVSMVAGSTRKLICGWSDGFLAIDPKAKAGAFRQQVRITHARV
jgi:hypothetical protein